ncbi:copper resistance CopC family protein [Catelliglobosispora koreensis]|uniref:copper resistance CopC family protein n=1 Tax=Catelliglobosispora koreensis TaxID=129052 RepID=UPI0003679623|nr:copper resistance CopC family protein [Catelliglobosispora koreensis]
MLMKRIALGIAALAVAVFGVQAPAFAHNSLVERLPEKDAALTQAPAEVKQRWLASLKPTAKMTVTGPDGASAIGELKIDGKFMSAPFTGKTSGKYTVAYEVPSDDGHPITGSYGFTLTLPEPEPVKLTQSPTPAASSPAAAATPETKSENTPWLPWIGGAAVAGLVVGGLISFLRNRRQRV